MSGTGSCYGNARVESFFVTLQKIKALSGGHDFVGLHHCQEQSVSLIHYYNLRNITSVNGGLSPSVCRSKYFEAIL